MDHDATTRDTQVELSRYPPNAIVPKVLEFPKNRIAFIIKEKNTVVCMMATKIKKGKIVDSYLHDRLDGLLPWLETEIRMSPKLLADTRVDKMLEIMFDGKICIFPNRYSQQAKALYDKWEAENWGRGDINEEVEAEDDDTAAALVERTGFGRLASSTDVKPVPEAHPIWGPGGIMYGAALTSTNVKIIRPDLLKRNFKVHGHNALTVGSWWPYQLIAYVYGCHGERIAGISGDSTAGAYSIVLSGKYIDLDRDCGDTIFYSGSGSHENKDPDKPASSTRSTKALKVSLDTGTPVRVLRAAALLSSYSPSSGIRYDGLYKVVRMACPKNLKGGLYEQFELTRLPDQLPLKDVNTPTVQQRKDFQKIKDGY